MTHIKLNYYFEMLKRQKDFYFQLSRFEVSEEYNERHSKMGRITSACPCL